MYEREYDTGWEQLDRDDLVERAYALGVDAGFGTYHEEEYERLLDLARSSYDRSFVELAFQEGRSDADAVATDDTDHEEAWDALVRDGSSTTDDPEAEPSEQSGPPKALDRIEPQSSPDDGLDKVRLPDFLRR